jgi:protein arginine N-methyltransferase 7
LNAQAAKLQKEGDLVGAVATYHALFAKARQSNVTHPELYVCHSNCSGAYLALGMFTEAAAQADSCQTLAYGSLRRWGRGSGPQRAIASKGPRICLLANTR